MRVSGKRQGIYKWSNGWSRWIYFQREKSKFDIKCKDVNKYKNSIHFTFSLLFVNYKREEVEIRHVPSWYDKEQLPSLTSTQLVFFGEFHIQQVIGPPKTSNLNQHNIRFPRDEEGNIDVKNGNYFTNNKTKNNTFK